VTLLVLVSVFIISAVALYGERKVIHSYTDLADFAVRMIGYFTFVALFISAMYWLTQIIHGLHIPAGTKAQVVFLVSYLLGSIPFGLIFTKFSGYGDIRKIGSGNIGATNVLRTGNKELAALTFFMDAAKGMAAVLVADEINPALGAAAGIGALLGHLYPIWLEFKGGKGVATAIGAITALSWPVGIVVIVLWIIVAVLFRYSSLAAIISVGAAPFLGISLVADGEGAQLLSIFVMAIFVLMRHVGNIRRLLKGEEPKIGDDIDPETRAK